MYKEINIDNEEEILKECDFDYYYDSENCSRELCKFYNDILLQKENYNQKEALIDLGRIAITLNRQYQKIKELKQKNRDNKIAIDKLEKIRDFCENWKRTEPYVDYVIIEEKSGIRTVPTLYEEIDKQIKLLEENI